MRIACFDLDHTLIEGDSDALWMRHLAAAARDPDKHDPRALLTHIDASMIDVAVIDKFLRDHSAGTLDVGEYFRVTLAPYAGTRMADLLPALCAFYRGTLKPLLRPRVLARLRAEQASGALTLLVTATNEVVVRPLFDALGFDALIATNIARERGRLVARVDGQASLGQGKALRIAEWLRWRGTSFEDLEDSAFYGDSINDSFPMQHVRRPVAVGPDAKLATLARDRGWEILDPQL